MRILVATTAKSLFNTTRRHSRPSFLSKFLLHAVLIWRSRPLAKQFYYSGKDIKSTPTSDVLRIRPWKPLRVMEVSFWNMYLIMIVIIIIIIITWYGAGLFRATTRPILIVRVKFWKVARWNTKLLLLTKSKFIQKVTT